MTVIIGVFDDAVHLEQAVLQLNKRNFSEQVFDQSIVDQEVGHVHGPGLYAVPRATARAERFPEVHKSEVAKLFKDHLRELRLPPEAVEGYATSFNHGGQFVVVRTGPDQAAAVMDILRAAQATRVHRHH